MDDDETVDKMQCPAAVIFFTTNDHQQGNCVMPEEKRDLFSPKVAKPQGIYLFELRAVGTEDGFYIQLCIECNGY